MLNKILLIGNLARNPEVGNRDNPRTAFTLATDRWWYSDGERKETTDFHRVVAFGSQAERTADLTKGQLLFVEGRQQTRQWQDGDAKRYITEVIAERIEILERSDESDD